jgi:hypothetical protein
MFPLLLTCVPLTAPADLEGKVVRIADGDMLTVLVDKQQVRVRLSSIDAPEKGQDFSQWTHRALADLVFGNEVKIVTHGKIALSESAGNFGSIASNSRLTTKQKSRRTPEGGNAAARIVTSTSVRASRSPWSP